MHHQEDLFDPFVVDTGSYQTKAGIAGEDTPNSIIHTVIGRKKQNRNETFFVGFQPDLNGTLDYTYPIDRGVIKNMDDYQKVLVKALKETQVYDSRQYRNILLAEDVHTSISQMESLTEMIFEVVEPKGLSFSNSSILSLYESGRTTGVVLECGHGSSRVVPVYEGFEIIHPTIGKVELGGKDVDEYLKNLLESSLNYKFEDFNLVRDIKEKHCYVVNSDEFNLETFDIPSTYELPDGEKLKIGDERFQATEILFHPEMISKDYLGVSDLVGSIINECSHSIRRELYTNVVLSGSTTKFRGFPFRIRQELCQKYAAKGVKVKIVAPPERSSATWIGGSILASLSSFDNICMTKDEYKENGTSRRLKSKQKLK